MQVALVDPGRQVASHSLERAAAARSSAAAGVAEIRPISATTEAANEAHSSRMGPMRGGLRSLDTQLNQRVTASQRTIEFLGHVDAELQSLRTRLSAEIGVGHSEGDGVAELSQQIRRFDALWRQRHAATGGALDNQLDQVEPGAAQQRFKVRGLTIDSLTKGDAETLYLAVGGRTERAGAVTIEPGLDAAEIAQRFDRALAPSGVRVTQDRHGELVFSVREGDWTNARDLLAIKGDGRRFPTGQFTAARIVPEEPLIRPRGWSVENRTAMRETLEKVTAAQEVVRHARRLATEALNDEGRNLTRSADAEAQERTWSAEFARMFAATAGKGDYRTLSALSPALLGMHRDRVTALLSAG
jgi:hypothetical protein